MAPEKGFAALKLVNGNHCKFAADKTRAFEDPPDVRLWTVPPFDYVVSDQSTNDRRVRDSGEEADE
jgi:hypothetical protein